MFGSDGCRDINVHDLFIQQKTLDDSETLKRENM
jgi:hypothetical protein